MAERVTYRGVIWDDLVMVPVREPDGTWVVLNRDGTDYWKSSQHVRAFVKGMKRDGIPAEEIELWAMLADVMDEAETDHRDGCSGVNSSQNKVTP